MMKHQYLWISILLILSVVEISCVAAPASMNTTTRTVAATSVSPQRVTLCASAVSTGMVTGWYALENGLFEKYGLDVDLVHIRSGSQAAATMIAGEVDFCQIGGSSVVNAVVAGEDLVMIGGLFNTYVYSLMVSPSIETAADLQGKAVAISRPGSSSDTAARAALAGLGLEPDRDVAIMPVGGQSERLAAMETGAVAGTMLSVPETAEAMELGYRELVDMTAQDAPYLHTGIATTRRYIEANREIVVKFMQAMVEAIALMKSDRDGTMAVLAKYLLMDVEDDAASLTEAYDKLVQGYLPQVPYPTLEGIDVLLEELEAENPNASNFTAEAVVDLSFVKELVESGFIADLYD